MDAKGLNSQLSNENEVLRARCPELKTHTKVQRGTEKKARVVIPRLGWAEQFDPKSSHRRMLKRTNTPWTLGM